MRAKSDQFNFVVRLLLAGSAALAVTLLATNGALRTRAQSTDLSGMWSMRYFLSCTATLSQTGKDVTGAYDCGSPAFAGPLQGTYNSGAISLTGHVQDAEDVSTVLIQGTVAWYGSMTGTFTTVPPFVDAGRFLGTRAGKGSDVDVVGSWSLLVTGVFSENCAVEVRQDGTALQTSSGCGPVPALRGTYSATTGAVTFQGTVFDQDLTIDGTTDGASIDGTWTVTASGERVLGGIFRAERLSGPTPQQATSTPSVALTVTPASSALPAAGGGPGDRVAFTAAILATALLGGAALAAGISVSGRRRQ